MTKQKYMAESKSEKTNSVATGALAASGSELLKNEALKLIDPLHPIALVTSENHAVSLSRAIFGWCQRSSSNTITGVHS